MSTKCPSPNKPSPAKSEKRIQISSRSGSSMIPTRWQRLFSTFKRNKLSGDDSGNGGDDINDGKGNDPSSSTHPSNVDASSFKHSHNCSNSFLRAGVSNMKGYKKANQDRCTAFSYLERDPELAYFAVYDGHGGTGVANFLKDHLHEFILDQAEYKEGNIEEAILKAFLQVDDELRSYGSATELTGSTATVVLIKHGDLICANLGDSRATACVNGTFRPLTTDHNTANAKERERVYAMGGSIKDNRVGGVLIPTRSFGDFLLKSELDKPAWKQVISAMPQIEVHKISGCWEFVVMGSDGVWDAMTNAEMILYIRSRLDSTKCRDRIVLSTLCEQILDVCCAKTVCHYGKNSCDNMTIIIIWFDHGDRSETGSSVVSSCISR